MSAYRNIAVIDIGKTNAKVALVDLDRLAEIDMRRLQPDNLGIFRLGFLGRRAEVGPVAGHQWPE